MSLLNKIQYFPHIILLFITRLQYLDTVWFLFSQVISPYSVFHRAYCDYRLLFNQDSDSGTFIGDLPSKEATDQVCFCFDTIAPSNVFCTLATGAGTGAEFLCLSGAASFHDPPEGSALCQPGSNPSQPHQHRTPLLHGNGNL